MEEDEKKAVEHARAKYPKVDMVVEIYTMQALWSSESMAKKLGYEEKEMVKISVRDFMVVGPDDLLGMMSGFTKNVKENVQTVRKKNGEKIRMSANVSPFIINKAPYLALGNVKNVGKASPKKK